MWNHQTIYLDWFDSVRINLMESSTPNPNVNSGNLWIPYSTAERISVDWLKIQKDEIKKEIIWEFKDFLRIEGWNDSDFLILDRDKLNKFIDWIEKK